MPKKTLVVTRRLPDEVESRIIRDYVARFNAENRKQNSPFRHRFITCRSFMYSARGSEAKPSLFPSKDVDGGSISMLTVRVG